MESFVKTDDRGRVLWLRETGVEVGIALDFGIRVVHMSCEGMENLYYRQPADLSDGYGTPDAWKLRGGHRMWLAPESDDSYHPDDDPISYTLLPDGVLLEQDTDPLMGLKKFLTIRFVDGCVRLEHEFKNMTGKTITGASWGVNTLDGSGAATVPFPRTGSGSFNPQRTISLWGNTSLSDERIRWEKDALVANHKATDDYFKMGLYCSQGCVTFRNKGQQLTLRFGVPPMDALPDGGCNFELFMCPSFMELETLGAVGTMAPGESVTHWETWKLEKI